MALELLPEWMAGRNTGRSAEITINLEWRVCIEQVGICAASAMRVGSFVIVRAHVTQQTAIHLISLLIVEQTREKIDSPAGTPAGCLKATQFKRAACRCR